MVVQGADQVETIVLQADADPSELWLVALFESKEEYHANAGSPEQHQRTLSKCGCTPARLVPRRMNPALAVDHLRFKSVLGGDCPGGAVFGALARQSNYAIHLEPV
jgi:hypothetical protein